MNAKRQRFVEEYLVDLNATQAAVRAGYSVKRADQSGKQLLSFIEVQNAINAALAERSEKTKITADRVLKELATLAFTDFRKAVAWGPDGVTLLPSGELGDDEAAIIAEVTETRSETGGSIKAKRYDKLKALELLGRHLGMFSDRVDLRHSGEVALVNVFDPETRAALLASIKDDD
ncbi:MAG: terminase small subunit [Synergistaceae bacterium]|jgi:phage terminase small subunit|nr:terminase small subunit [Synergistaceae bacterium]